MPKNWKGIFSRYETGWLTAIVFLGLLLRLGLIFATTEPIDRDAEEYYRLAQNLVAGKGFSIDGVEPTARRSPGYPIFLSGVIALFGPNPKIIYIIQAFVNVLTLCLIFHALKSLRVKSPYRLLVTFLFTLSTSLVFVNVLYAEIVTMFVVALLLYINLHPALQSKPSLQSLVNGILLGCLIHLRPTFLYLPVFLLVLTVTIKMLKRQFVFKYYFVTVLVTSLTVLPWTVRNYIEFKQFIPLVSAGGGELWSANYEIAERVVWHSVTDIRQYENERKLSHARQKALLTQYRQQHSLETAEELNRFLSKQGRVIILQHPFRYTLLCLNRALIFWFSPPIGSTTLKSISPAIFWFFLLLKYSLTILGIFGLWRWAQDNFSSALTILTVVVYLTLLHAATHSIQRYFLPLIPVMYFALGYFFHTSNSFILLRTPHTQSSN